MAKEVAEKVVKFTDTVIIEGTAKSKHITTGRKVEVHKVLADRLIKKGSAILVKETPKKEEE